MVPIDSTHPEWMEKIPEPRQEERKFNELAVVGWNGRASIDKLEPWVGNPRIDDPVERWIDQNPGKKPTKDDLLDIMLDNSVDSSRNNKDEDDENVDARRSPTNALVELADNIRLNEIRSALIVTHDRRILDGNRRYLANYYLYINADEDEREKYKTVPVWVLPKGIGDRDEDRILTELNAISDCYIPWNYSVMAKRIYQDKEKGLTDEALQKKYHNYTKSRIRQTIEAYRVAREFLDHHNDNSAARERVFKKLIWFDELARSNSHFMDKVDFKEAIFDLVLSPNSPFSSHTHFRKLGEIYNNPEAWRVLTSSNDKEALQKALFVLDRERYEGRSDATSKINRINDLLASVVTGGGFGSVDSNLLKSFHNLAYKVPNPALDARTRAQRLMDLLNNLTSIELAQLPTDVLSSLGEVVERVKDQAGSSKKSGI